MPHTYIDRSIASSSKQIRIFISEIVHGRYEENMKSNTNELDFHLSVSLE